MENLPSATVPKVPIFFEEIREVPLEGHVGFDNLPEQLIKKSVLDGFSFNVLCIGETGIGKSSLISSLFYTEYDESSSMHKHGSVKLKSTKHFLNEMGISLAVTVVETVGYGDLINKENSFTPILNYIDEQFEKFFREETKINRSLTPLQDSRIHVCLYFICPTGHTLKPADLLCMKSLGQKVNIIPLIAKSDTLTRGELQKFKAKVRSELEHENVQIYNFPITDSSSDGYKLNVNEIVPFAVVGSTDYVLEGNKMVRGRSYPWGTISISNETHSDFPILREVLIETNMLDLVELTHDQHYENYRVKRLEQLGCSHLGSVEDSGTLMDTLEKKLEDMRQEFRLEKEEIERVFIEKVKLMDMEFTEAEKAMRDKYRLLDLKAQEEKRSLDLEEKILNRDIEDLMQSKNCAFIAKR